jgi:GNS1/SUR4 family
MSEILSMITWENYEALLAKGDPLVRDWPLMNPLHMLGIIGIYLVVIFVLKAYTKNMKEGFKLRTLSIVHNIHLTALSAYMMIEIIRQARMHNYTLWDNAVDSENQPGMARIIWIYYCSKVVEFVDTCIMALKKNYHQITFLHVYHHASIFAVWWVITYYTPGGEAYFSAALNSFIHVVMYGYYLWRSFARKLPKGEKPRWTNPAFYRPYITSMQMMQFVTMMVQATYDIVYGTKFPRFAAWILFIYMISMLALFGNFFIKQYCKKGSKKNAKKTN